MYRYLIGLSKKNLHNPCMHNIIRKCMYFLYIIVHAEYLVLRWYEDVTLTSFDTSFCFIETIILIQIMYKTYSC
jgi:hypothetical protein